MVAFNLLVLAGLLAPATASLINERHNGFSSRSTEPPKFGYSGVTGPLGWHLLDTEKNGACAHGHEQSPIDIHDGTHKEVLDCPEARPELHYETTSGRPFKNLGTTVEVEVSGTLKLPGDGSEWDLAQFHFHTPSEHRISEEYYPLEMHMVHKKKDDPTKLLVLGLVFDLSEDSSTTPIVHDVLAHLPSIPHSGDRCQTDTLDFAEIANHVKNTDIYKYGGSLTTPPCTEGVTWLVSSVPLPLDVASFNKVKRVVKYNSRVSQNDPGLANLEEVSCSH